MDMSTTIPEVATIDKSIDISLTKEPINSVLVPKSTSTEEEDKEDKLEGKIQSPPMEETRKEEQGDMLDGQDVSTHAEDKGKEETNIK